MPSQPIIATSPIQSLVGKSVKRCSKCGDIKTICEFKRDHRKKSGYGSHCLACGHAATLRWHERTREQRGIKRRVETPDCGFVRPDARIIGADGRDWTWAFVIFAQPLGYEGYLVGSDGALWSCLRRVGLGAGRGFTSELGDRWVRKAGAFDADGYRLARLYRGGVGTAKRMACLVLETFLPKPSGGLQACHNNGIRTDDRLENLRWDTVQGNTDDRKRHGTIARGKHNGRAKMTEAHVMQIRESSGCGMSRRGIADALGLTKDQVARVLRGKTWRHVEAPAEVSIHRREVQEQIDQSGGQTP